MAILRAWLADGRITIVPIFTGQLLLLLAVVT